MGSEAAIIVKLIVLSWTVSSELSKRVVGWGRDTEGAVAYKLIIIVLTTLYSCAK